jgi:hypothetical protein
MKEQMDCTVKEKIKSILITSIISTYYAEAVHECLLLTPMIKDQGFKTTNSNNHTVKIIEFR